MHISVCIYAKGTKLRVTKALHEQKLSICTLLYVYTYIIISAHIWWYMGFFYNWGTAVAGWFLIENPCKQRWFGVPQFRTPDNHQTFWTLWKTLFQREDDWLHLTPRPHRISKLFLHHQGQPGLCGLRAAEFLRILQHQAIMGNLEGTMISIQIIVVCVYIMILYVY